MTKKILVADQDPSVRRMVARVLETADYAAILSDVGSETVSTVRDLRPDLLLLELNSPDPEGWEIVERIRQAAPELPVILITGWPNLRPEALQKGIQWFMEKPLDLTELLALIQRLLLEPARTGRQRDGDTKVEPVFEGGLALASAVRS